MEIPIAVLGWKLPGAFSRLFLYNAWVLIKIYQQDIHVTLEQMERFEYSPDGLGSHDIGRISFCLVGKIYHLWMAADICRPAVCILHRDGVWNIDHAPGRHAGNPGKGKSSSSLKNPLPHVPIISLTLTYPYDNSLVFSKAGMEIYSSQFEKFPRFGRLLKNGILFVGRRKTGPDTMARTLKVL